MFQSKHGEGDDFKRGRDEEHSNKHHLCLLEVKCTNQCYFQSFAKMTYAEGDALCKSLNTKLLHLKSEEENVGVLMHAPLID